MIHSILFNINDTHNFNKKTRARGRGRLGSKVSIEKATSAKLMTARWWYMWSETADPLIGTRNP